MKWGDVKSPLFIKLYSMSLIAILEDTIREELDGSDYFLVGSTAEKNGSRLKFFLDGDEGIPIEECSRISRLLSRKIDEEELGDKPFRLEVSSPGVDMPLVNPRQYAKHVGRELSVTLKDENTFKGKLLKSTLDNIEIEKYLEFKKGKPVKIEKTTIDMADIKETTVLISFK